MEDKRIAVVGAGLMGHGIALVMARAGNQVTVTDPDETARAELPARIRGSMELMGAAGDIDTSRGRITVVGDLAEAVDGAGIVFEAAPEKMELKQALFAEIEKHAPRDCILASNTSVMPITAIMEGLRHKDRGLGTHWWNPPHMIPLVEVVRTGGTSEDVVGRMVALLDAAGKTPVRVEQDVPGFIGNRLQHALWREAVSLVERGICDAEAVDTVVKSRISWAPTSLWTSTTWCSRTWRTGRARPPIWSGSWPKASLA